jgi:enamine deaminase RidA (YjgF/YER057c/UK114 family)
MTGFTFLKVAETGEDVVAETTASFAAVSEALDAAGLSMRDLVKIRLLYTERSDFPQMNSVRNPLFRSIFTDDDFPSATGVCTGGSGEGGSSPRFELEVIAAPQKQVRYADEVVRRFGDVTPPYAHVNVANGAAFLSGQGAFDTDGVFRASGPVEEATKALATFQHSLARADRSIEDVIAVTTYLKLSVMTPLEVDAVLAKVRDFVATLGSPVPTVTCVGVDDLAFEGMTVEIEVIAGAPGGDRVTSTLVPARWAGGSLAGGSTALRSGGLVVGSASAGSAREAADVLARAVSEVGGISPGALLTAWYTPDLERVVVDTEAAAALGGTIPSLVPMPPGPGSDPGSCVTLELFGNAQAR